MQINNNIQAFFALVAAGLWEQEVQLSQYDKMVFGEVLHLAEEQSVVGLVAAGLEHVVDVKVPKADVLQIVGQALQLEQQNSAMNYFISVIVEKLHGQGINTLLVKGQGIAQCYERPLWRACGDVDLFLSEDNYEKAKAYLTPLATSVSDEHARDKHLGMTIDPWVLELHGRLYCGLSSIIDKELDRVYYDTFCVENVRTWNNDHVQVLLLSVENDAFYVFTHILQHFYRGGIGLRQICDWSRLLWTYKDSLNSGILKDRLCRARLMSEWKAFGAFAVDYLGMPADAMVFYSPEKKWKRKASMICTFVIEVGNFGHNRDNSYFGKYPYLIRKAVSLGQRIIDLYRHARLFPLDSLKFLPNIVINGLRSAIRGEG